MILSFGMSGLQGQARPEWQSLSISRKITRPTFGGLAMTGWRIIKTRQHPGSVEEFL